jgi:hypothetical protein
MQSSKSAPSVNENDGVSWLANAFSLTLFRGVQSPQGTERVMTWGELVERWQRPVVCGLKQYVPGWSPASFEGARRAKAGVRSVSALVLDYEPQACALPRGLPLCAPCPDLRPAAAVCPAGLAGEACEAILLIEDDVGAASGAKLCGGPVYLSGTRYADARDRLDEAGQAAVLHTSYSHRDPRKGAAERFRVVLPLSRPVSADEYPALWAAVVGPLLDAGHQIDESVKDASRFWFEPALREPGATYLLDVITGAVLDVDALLPAAAPVAPPASAPAPITSRPEVSPASAPRSTPAPITPPRPPPVRPSNGGGAGGGAPRRAAGEAPPEGTPARARYAAGALDRAEAAIRAAQPGQRSDALNKEAYGLGGLIGPELSESDVVARLLAATAGWPDPRKTESTLRRAVKAGMNNPRRGSSNGSTGERPGGANPASLGSWSMPARAAAAAGADDGEEAPPEDSGRFDDDGVEIPASDEAPASSPSPAPPAPPAGGGYPAGDDGEPEDDRPVVQITVDRHLALDATIVHLAARADIYQRAGKLVLCVEEWLSSPGGQPKKAPPQIRDVSKPHLAELLSRSVRFESFRAGRDGDPGDFEPCPAPGWLVDQVLDRGAWPYIRPLRSVASSPVLRADGTVLETPGYDPETGLLYAPQRAFLPVPAEASLDDAKGAVKLLFDLVRDFPFETRAHKSAWLAALLTPLARYAFEGPSPLVLIEANIRGSGKSKLAYIIGIIVSGATPENLSYSNDDVEMDKRLLSIAKSGDQITYFDNVDLPLGNGPLNNALTTTRYRGRILGGNDMACFDLLTTFMASGNNVQLAADMARRCLPIRLQSPEQNPEKRKVSDPKILATVANRRAEYLQAALTILRAYFVAGAPQETLSPWGSFEGWSDLIRSVITWVGLPDPGETRDALAENGDTEGQLLEVLIEGWALMQSIKASPDGLTVGDVLDDLAARPSENGALRDALAQLCNAQAGKLPSPKSVASRLSHLRDRVCNGRCLRKGERTKKGATWLVGDAPQPEQWEPAE